MNRLNLLSRQLQTLDCATATKEQREIELGIKICGVGHYLPRRVVENAELEKLIGKPPGYVEKTKAGVTTRRWAHSEEETSSKMGANSVREAIKEANLKLEDLDLIIYASGCPERAIPDTSVLVQKELGLGASGITCFSIHSTCLSFLTAFIAASSLLNSKMFSTIAIVCSEVPSACMNITHAEQCILFGDGAASVILQRTPEGEGSKLISHVYHVYGDGADLTTARGGGVHRPPESNISMRRRDKEDPIPLGSPAENVFFMDGPKVIEYAMKFAFQCAEELRPGLSTGMAGIDLIIPHQPSALALKIMENFGWKIMNIIEHHGNMMAASIPLALYYAIKEGKLKRGQKCGFIGLGAGLGIGGVVIQY